MGIRRFVGTWKTNASKSKLAQVGDWMKQATVTFGEVGDQFTFDYKGILVNGSSFSHKGNRPLVGGILQSAQLTEGTVAYVTLIGPGDAYVTTFQNGKQTVLEHYVVSKDGKTLAITTKGMDLDTRVRLRAFQFLQQHIRNSTALGYRPRNFCTSQMKVHI
jgi:hypothetical protein